MSHQNTIESTTIAPTDEPTADDAQEVLLLGRIWITVALQVVTFAEPKSR